MLFAARRDWKYWHMHGSHLQIKTSMACSRWVRQSGQLVDVLPGPVPEGVLWQPSPGQEEMDTLLAAPLRNSIPFLSCPWTCWGFQGEGSVKAGSVQPPAAQGLRGLAPPCFVPLGFPVSLTRQGIFSSPNPVLGEFYSGQT